MSATSILVTGGTGFLGRRVVARASTNHDVVAAASHTPRHQPHAVSFDISDRSATMEAIVRIAPSVIIHAAAVNPGQGSDDAMARVNVVGSRNIASAAAEIGARLITVSTDVIHDGTAAPYGDDAPPTPINTYGRTKAEAEAAILDIVPTAAVVRTSLMYALDEMDRGTAEFAQRLTAGGPVRLFSDVLRNPIWVETLAEALVRLVDTDAHGTLNIAGREAMTRQAYGTAMLAFFGVVGVDRIQAVSAAELSGSIPLDVRLDSKHGENLLGMRFPGVTEVLASHPRGSARAPLTSPR